MTTHIVCRDCRFEAVVFVMDAERTVETHERDTGHEVESEEFDESERLVSDGGRPTLRLTDDGLELPDGVCLSGGVVVRARGITVDHKPGGPERNVYPALEPRHLEAEDIGVQNDYLDEDEVSVKQYGHDAETYEVVIPQTDGGQEPSEGDFEGYEEKLDELNDGLLEAYAAGFAKAVETSDIDPEFDADARKLKEVPVIQESHFYYWDGRQKPLKAWLRQHFLDTEFAEAQGGGV